MLQLKFATPNFKHALFLIILLCTYMQVSVVFSITDSSEVIALQAIRNVVGDGQHYLRDWVGKDPCSTTHKWNGIFCITGLDGFEHVTEVRLMAMEFTGVLSPAVGNLSHLTILNFMWNHLTGPVPPEIGKLSNLFSLLLNGNKFSGSLPPELGYLPKLNRIQIDSNNISGPLPESFQYLLNVKHIHLNNNSINGSIPKQLGKLPVLRHLLLENNDLSGELPSELSNISSLVILQLDNNHFSGPIPSTYSKLSKLYKLSVRNCKLNGRIPDLSSIANLSYLDLSNNKLMGRIPYVPRKSQYITTINLSYNELNGFLSTSYFEFPNLQRLHLQNNSLDGAVKEDRLIYNALQYGNWSLIMDFQFNNLSMFSESSMTHVTLRLFGNPVCEHSSAPSKYCIFSTGINDSPSFQYTPSIANSSCSPNMCAAANGKELVPGTCHCAYPLEVGYRLKSPSFSDFPPYMEGFYWWISSGLNLKPHQVHIEKYGWEPGPRLGMTIKLYPDKNFTKFQHSEVAFIYGALSSWSMPSNDTFGPYELLYVKIGNPYNSNI